MKRQEFTGLVMAGGSSVRFGSDKATYPVEGRRMIDCVVGAVERVVPDVMISVRQVRDAPPEVRGRPVADRLPGCGPLSGLEAGLSHARTAWLLVVACDMPYITSEALERLMTHCTPDVSVVAAQSSDGRLHPLCACFHRSIRPVVEKQLRSDDVSMHTLLRLTDSRAVPLADEVLRNVNTPADLS